MDTLFVGRNVIYLPKVESTNSYAINLLKNVKVSEGTVIHTNHQTNGKGQRGNAWHSEKDSNLILSVIFKPSFLSIQNQYYLYQFVALALHDFMSQIVVNRQIDIKIKWPNDIYINSKKIAGILIENIVANKRIEQSVIGIGINVNQTQFDERLNATSLSNLCNQSFDLKVLMPLLFAQIEKYYLLLRNGKQQVINGKYHHALYKINEFSNFEINGLLKNYKITGVSESGLLNLTDENGEMKSFDVKEIKWH
ncbi:MAG: biotin--[acetyl-CoA-carboxylase] ligase [Sphingobacteriaceae bacterium]|nr:biotin--[acetyl-CoA-carboxylase] ligase [Sphingobacteriaceae bacterium]